MSDSEFSYNSNDSNTNLSSEEFIDDNSENENVNENENELINSNNYIQNTNYANYQSNYNSNYIQMPEFIDLDLKCLPLIFYHHYDDIKYLENSSKIILPKRILYEISKYEDISYPLKFKINDYNTLFSVHEFRDDIDELLISNHYLANMSLEENSNCKVTLLTSKIDNGTKVTFKSHSSNFLDIPDHKGFLEYNLNKLYTHLTKNQTVVIPYNDEQIYIDVIKCEPSDSICIVDTDLEVDFEEPYDYKEYIKEKQEQLEKKKKEDLEKQKIENSKFKRGKFNFNQNFKDDGDSGDGNPFGSISGKS
jgi:ubiquitin fusion degradation protein 1